MSNENTDESPNYSETVGTRLSPETKRRLDQYKDDHEIGNAKAVRRLVRRALDDTDDTLDTVNKTALVAGAAYVAVVVVAGIEAAAAVGGAYIAILILWSSFAHVTG